MGKEIFDFVRELFIIKEGKYAIQLKQDGFLLSFVYQWINLIPPSSYVSLHHVSWGEAIIIG